MNYQSQKGIALVITLVMLSLVTLMVVVFLAVSRREKASVGVTTDFTDAQLMAQAALSRAESEVVARILSTSNRFNYDLLVSTNFINPAGFRPGVADPTNVSYTLPDGQLLNKDQQMQNIANLQYDPRPPVYLDTPGGVDFRFYVDFNRNRRFEPNGEGQLVGFDVGDPEWIGVLERPNERHSESNRFVGRYAYLVLPAGKSLDLNFIHNYAQGDDPNMRPAPGVSRGYFRNQGVGSWELNLAGFLADANTNMWWWSWAPQPGGYQMMNPGRNYLYDPRGLGAFSAAFDDALAILRYRYGSDLINQASAVRTLGAFASNFATNGVDDYSDGSLLVNLNNDADVGAGRDDPMGKAWPGSTNISGFHDVQELFDTNKTSPEFVNSLMVPMLSQMGGRAEGYDRYTFYRMLAQIGTESAPANSALVFQPNLQLLSTNRLHINYWNEERNGQTNFLDWKAERFFVQAADRMLKASLSTNPPVSDLQTAVGTNFFLGEHVVRPQISATNILLYVDPDELQNAGGGAGQLLVTNEYTPAVHRFLQLAANIFDATTNRTVGNSSSSTNLPSVFRPIFYRGETNLLISGYVEATNSAFLNNQWHTLKSAYDSFDPGSTLAGINIFGVPVIVGARKGYPNFNEFTMQNYVQVSRKLEVTKPNLAEEQPTLAWRTNQMYLVGISNVFGVELWNSYSQDYQRPYELRVTNRYSVALHLGTNALPFWRTNGMFARVTPTTGWAGRDDTNSFKVFQQSLQGLPLSVFNTNVAGFFVHPAAANFQRSFEMPQLVLRATNRLQYVMIDQDTRRILDMVNLDNLTSELDITSALVQGESEASGVVTGGSGKSISEKDFWIRAHLGGNENAPTIGVTNQVVVSLDEPPLDDAAWASWTSENDKPASIHTFRAFMGKERLKTAPLGVTRPFTTSMEVPYTPTRVMLQTSSWQANDPLVHYLAQDLVDLARTNDVRIVTPGVQMPDTSNLGKINPRYNPWGGNPNQPGGDINPRNNNVGLKDPLVVTSDNWDFPAKKFPNIGWLGRVHRGTPWQTIYLKAPMVDPELWLEWAGSLGSHPTNDWKLVDLFTATANDNAARGLLSVNQTNIAAWSAVLSGVTVLTNTVSDFNISTKAPPTFAPALIEPNSPQLRAIVDGINRVRTNYPQGRFPYMGAVLSAAELSTASPFLNTGTGEQQLYRITEEAYERIPWQILSLLKPDEPRVVVYSFGQSLRPAERSLATSGDFYNLCTNYQVTAEMMTKTVLRMEPVTDATNAWRAVVESYSVLPPE